MSFLIAALSLCLVGTASGSDLAVENLKEFKSRTCTRKSPIAGTEFHSWNVPQGKHNFFVAFPATEQMGRAEKEKDPEMVMLGTPQAEVVVIPAVYPSRNLTARGISTCQQLVNEIWGTMCPDRQCKMSEVTEVNSDGRKYQRARITMNKGREGKASFYQCSIGPETTLSVIATFNSPFGPFKKTSDLKTLLDNIYFSKER